MSFRRSSSLSQPRPSAHRPRRARRTRLGRRLLVVAVLASGLTVVPTPAVVWAEGVEIDSVRPAVTAAPSSHRSRVAGVRSALDADSREALAQAGRWRAKASAGFAVSILGTSLPEAPAAPVLVRVRNDGAWGPWREVEFNEDHAEDTPSPDARPGVHSEPIWVDDADAYELDLPAGSHPEVHLGRTVRTRQVQVRGRAASAAPNLLTRAQWGARPPKTAPVIADDMRLGVVHHSVTGNGYGPADVPGILRGIQAYHMDVRGWNDIAYNFAVDHFGRTWEARGGGTDQLVLGGHAAGFNTGSVGVVMLGDFTNVNPTNESVRAVGELLGWKFAVGGVEPAGTVPYTTTGGTKYSAGTTVTLPRIVGHRDVGQTGCPGSQLYARLDEIRTIARARYSSEAEAMTARPLTGNFIGTPGTDVLIERLGRGSDELWTWIGSGYAKSDRLAAGSFRPVAGDFNGDGFDDVFWHGPGSLNDHLWLGGVSGFHSGTRREVVGSYLPSVGDFDGDGNDDIYLYAEGLHNDAVLYGRDDASFGTVVRRDESTVEPLVGDFDGDGNDDILLHDPGQADHTLLYGTDSRGFTARNVRAAGAFQPFVGDFNGDRRSDIFWYTPSSQGDWLYFGSAGRGFSATMYQAIGQFTPVVGDFSDDGVDDVLWYSPANVKQAYWKFTSSGGSGSSAWVNGRFLPRVLDVDADGADDILWYSSAGSVTWRGSPGGFSSSAS